MARSETREAAEILAERQRERERTRDRRLRRYAAVLIVLVLLMEAATLGIVYTDRQAAEDQRARIVASNKNTRRKVDRRIDDMIELLLRITERAGLDVRDLEREFDPGGDASPGST
jgi:hypothetical protein